MSDQRKALIIANDEYEQEALHDLLAPGADAEALGRVLGDAQIGGFSVRVVRNEPSYVIEAQIEDLFSESRPDDLLLLHFSGHGLKSESGELFFAASNTKPNRLGSTAVSADFVQRCMRDSRSRSVVLLLDCCYGGAFAQGVKVRAAGDANVLDSFPQGRSGGRGRAVITASNAMEYAFEGDRLADDQHQRPSVFTGALVEGLTTGEADRDEDGLVSLNELYDYVFDKVREQNPHQTPSRQVELEGELYLARSQRRRIRPAPIPPELQAAITDPNMYTRRGAVHELQSRLASADLPVAAGAYQALAELARTDIQYVADLATAALRQAAVCPEETELHFGEQRQGSDPPHRIVPLLGPPIARACASRASHDWIRVNEIPEGLDISVDTASTGTMSGSVDLKGTTGTAVIAVDVELLPRSQTAQPPATEPHHVDVPPARESATTPSSAQAPAPSRPSTLAHQGLVAATTVPAAGPEGRSPAADRQQSSSAAEPAAAGSGGQARPAAKRAPLPAPVGRSGVAMLLGAGFIIVTVGLFIAALTTFSTQVHYSSWPWQVILVINIIGIAFTVGAVRQYAVRATIVLWVLVWGLVYSPTVLGALHSSAPSAAKTLVPELIAGAVVSIALCVWIVVLLSRRTRNVGSFLAIFLGLFSLALVLAAVATQQAETGAPVGTLWRVVGVVAIAAALVPPIALIRQIVQSLPAVEHNHSTTA